MSSVNLFSNKPLVAQRPASVTDMLQLKHFDALSEADPNTSSWQKCGDPNLGTTWRKNVLHQVIRCGGAAIDLNELEDMFPYVGQSSLVHNSVGSKEWYNHYVADADFNIFSASNVKGASAGASIKFPLLPSNHTSNGKTSYPSKGYILLDKENFTSYTILSKDETIDYNHIVEVQPNDGATVADIKANKAYLVLPARQVGGCHSKMVTNNMHTIGYSQKIQTIGVRKDWKICIDTLSGYKDLPQYTITYDMNGNQVDNWMASQEMDMRNGIRMTLNALSFAGTPTTNSALINAGGGIGTDDNHKGFYGMIPSIEYAGGNVYPITGAFDFQADGEPLFLYQDSRKRTRKFFVLHGLKWRFGVTDRTNGLVERTGVGSDKWDAFIRLSDTRGEDYLTSVAKLGVKSYEYDGFELDMKKMNSWSDYRYFGSDMLNGSAVFVPKSGIKENGQEINPIEFNTFGQGQWNGNYEEYFIDYRTTENAENAFGGWAAQYTAFTMHCPNQWIFVKSIKAN